MTCFLCMSDGSTMGLLAKPLLVLLIFYGVGVSFSFEIQVRSLSFKSNNFISPFDLVVLLYELFKKKMNKGTIMVFDKNSDWVLQIISKIF